jgi:hypothetical protein
MRDAIGALIDCVGLMFGLRQFVRRIRRAPEPVRTPMPVAVPA